MKHFIVAEDLRQYGFDVVWNETERSLVIIRIPGKEPDKLSSEKYKVLTKRGIVGRKGFDTYRTDIALYLKGALIMGDGQKVETVNVDGKTLVDLSTLAKYYGMYQWNPETRTVNVLIENDYATCKTDSTNEKTRVTKVFGYLMEGPMLVILIPIQER